MKLKHMAQKSKKGPPMVAGGNGDGGTSGSTYPYGLKLQLDHETLTHLGMKGVPKVGSHVHFHVKAHVESAEQRHDKGGKTRNASLQITHMAVGKPDADSAVGAVEDGISQADES